MRQTTLSVPLEVKPESCPRLVLLIEELKQRQSGPKGVDPNFAGIIAEVPMLHFMSISVFLESDYDPVLIFEANFDGRAQEFWPCLEGLIGEDLREMIRCCKTPRDTTKDLYEAVTRNKPNVDVTDYLQARAARPTVFHHGNRGLSCDQIRAERALFLSVTQAIDPPGGASPYRGVTPEQVHKRLRAAMLQGHAWLAQPAPTRISLGDRALDGLRFLVFFLAVFAILAAPGALLAGLGPGKDVGFWTLVGGATLLVVLTCRAWADRWLAARGCFAGVVALSLGCLAVTSIGSEGWRFGALALVSVLFLLAIVALWLRTLELRDSPQDYPQLNERIRRKMLRREDWVTQNHMGSIVLVKPGVLRSILLHAGHLGLHLILRISKDARAGFLGSMRTVHFAHWALLNNNSRLLFCSNFDHGWDSYLDDFIEKAHVGLTLAWSCGVGFPTTWLLFGEGATQGRRFKAWALASRTVSRFWYSAYPDLTVDQIERQHRIANGLRKRNMNAREAVEWMRDL